MAKAYGPPGYGEVPRRDRTEDFLLLTLDTSICVDGDPNNAANSEGADNVKAVQVVYGDKHPFNRKWLGQPVVVTGTLFRAHTGHHRTTVLIQAREVHLIGRE